MIKIYVLCNCVLSASTQKHTNNIIKYEVRQYKCTRHHV